MDGQARATPSESAMSPSRDKDDRAKPDRPASGMRPRVVFEEGAGAASGPEDDAAEVLRRLDEAALWLPRVPAGPLHRALQLTPDPSRPPLPQSPPTRPPPPPPPHPPHA